jgi:hypothetical protein
MRKVKKERFIRHLGIRMRIVEVPEGQSIPKGELEGLKDIPDDLVRFCKTFFSRKDWNQWRFKQAGIDPGSFDFGRAKGFIYIKGICDKKYKFILMHPFFCSRRCADVFRVTILLHEMSHAVTTERHTEKFFDRLERCKRFAQKLGYDPLVKILDKEIKEVKKEWRRIDDATRKT